MATGGEHGIRTAVLLNDMERGEAPLRGAGRHGGTQFNIATIVGQGGVQHHGGAVSRYEDGGAPPGGGGGI